MKFGVCTPVRNVRAAYGIGWDFIEESVQHFIRGTIDDELWSAERPSTAPDLPILAANSLVPSSIKIVGPDARFETWTAYMEKVLQRAKITGIATLVFGSSGARNVPEGFDRVAARGQILEFLRGVAPMARDAGVTIVVEPLNTRESNIINSVAEAMEYVQEVDHPNLQCLVDSYHFWMDDEPLDNLRAAMPWIKHVHLADKDGRTAPGRTGKSDYAPFFATLKAGNYQGHLSVEAPKFSGTEMHAEDVLRWLKKTWQTT